MCRGLAALIARGYPAEDLCETYNLTPEQLSRAATTPVFSNAFAPLAADDDSLLTLPLGGEIRDKAATVKRPGQVSPNRSARSRAWDE